MDRKRALTLGGGALLTIPLLPACSGGSSGPATVPPAGAAATTNQPFAFGSGAGSGTLTPLPNGGLVGRLLDGTTFAASAPANGKLTMTFTMPDGTTTTTTTEANDDGSANYSDSAGHRVSVSVEQRRQAAQVSQLPGSGNGGQLMGGSMNGYTFFGTALSAAAIILGYAGIAAAGPIGWIGFGIGLYGYFSGKG